MVKRAKVYTKGVNLAECVETDPSSSTHTEDVVFRVGNRSSDPYQVMIKINGKPVIMKIDTGAAVSLMSSQSYNPLFPKTIYLTETYS